MDPHVQAFEDWRAAFVSMLEGAAAAFERKNEELLERADGLAIQCAQRMAYRRQYGMAPIQQQSPMTQQLGGIPVPQGMVPAAIHYAPAAQQSHYGGGPLMGPGVVPPPMQPMNPAPPPAPSPHPGAATHQGTPTGGPPTGQ